MISIFKILVRFLIVLYSLGTNIAIAQMGLHANLYLSASQSLAIENEAPPSLTTGALISINRSFSNPYGIKLQNTGNDWGTMIFTPGVGNTLTSNFISFGHTPITGSISDDTMVEHMPIVNHNGYVAIGRTDFPNKRLTVNGNPSKVGEGSWASFSDRRVKQNIRRYDKGITEILQIKPVLFNYNEK